MQNAFPMAYPFTLAGLGERVTGDGFVPIFVEVDFVELAEAGRIRIARHVRVTETLQDRGRRQHLVGDCQLTRPGLRTADEGQEVEHLLGLR